jgi:spore germination protein KA
VHMKSCNSLPLTTSLEQNISMFEDIFDNDDTLIKRRFQNKHLPAAKCCLLYFDSMVNIELLNENIILPILANDLSQYIDSEDLLEELRYKVIAANNVEVSEDVEAITSAMMSGETIFLLEGYDKALIISAQGWEKRAVTEPQSSRVIRGPREGFTEYIRDNLAMVRRRIKDPSLKFKFRELGTRTKTQVCICYVEELVMDGLVKELESRLDNIEIDGVLDSGYIQELIRDEPFSLFDTVGASERPDVIASKLLEGRVALFVDGSPFVLTVPYIIAEVGQSNEDYYNNFIFSSFNRLLRTLSAIMAFTIPAIFLAIVTHHHEMLPTPLLLSISAAREGVPVPTALSLFTMLIIFDIVREAGIRMPEPIGQAISIVGTLVLGQAAVDAKLVSAPVIIITALTGILTLLNKNLITSTIMLRLIFLTATGFYGIYGFIFAFIILILNLMGMRSFGVPYMMGTGNIKNGDGQDIWVRAPWWTMTLRPKIIGAKNILRQATGKSRRKRSK